MSKSGFKLAEPAEMRKAAVNMIALMKTLNELQRELTFGRPLEPSDFDSIIGTCQTIAVTTGALCEQVAALKESVRTLEARSLGLDCPKQEEKPHEPA